MKNSHWIFVVSLIVFGKATGFLKDVMLTFFHGVSVVTDAYFLSSAITTLLHAAVYLSIPVVVVPLYVRLKEAGDRASSDQKMSATLLLFVSLSFSLTLVGVFGAPNLLSLFAPDVDDSVYDSAIRLLPIMSASFALSSIVAISNAVQTVNKVTTPSYVVPLVNNSIFCIGLLIFSDSHDFHKVIILGILSWVVLVAVNYQNSRKWFSLKFDGLLTHFPTKSFLLLLLPAVISFYVEQANSFVGVYFAAELGAGAISILTYANKLSLIFLSVFVVFLTASLFPRMATVASRGDKDEISRYILAIVGTIVVLGGLLVLLMAVFSSEVVKLLFQRGSFGQADALAVSAVFAIAVVALPFCLIRDVMNRVYFSYNNTKLPVLLSGASFVFNVFLSFLLYREYELSGLVTAAVVSVALNCVVVFVLAQYHFGIKLVQPILRTLVSSGVAIACTYALHLWLDGLMAEFWLLQTVPMVALYFAILLIARNSEALATVRYLRRGKWRDR